MKLSAPIYRLKRQAKILSRNEDIPLHEALDQTARAEGFDSWSLLANRVSKHRPGRDLLAELKSGDLVLLGARPGHGKTLLGLELAIEAMKAGQRSVFFSLEFSEADLASGFAAVGEIPDAYRDRFEFEDSDDISADFIIQRMRSALPGTVVVIDYLQLLDQKRDNPDIMDQVSALKAFAQDRKLIVVFLSQIDRRYDPRTQPFPEAEDIRLPNPLDLTLFDRMCFLNDGEINITATV